MYWTHHAYLLSGGQNIQISYLRRIQHLLRRYGQDSKKLYVFNNDEVVLYDRGSAVKKYNEWGSDPWKFSEYGSMWLEVVKSQ